ncbi:SAM-dependent chlorinase/fluorinase [Actinocorallia sp. B10E7]|uniref:SAM hydrolase/SAM-dependent halogenase family protein n=1 Tax=Actinocorallia sp. B10E7 TaxID=3153558 RepID=UPI00325F4C3D
MILPVSAGERAGTSPYVSITTDFGAAYTGICAGVVARIAPTARVQVLSDEVSKYAVVEGALLLEQALPHLPVGVHLAVVDPGVGTLRHPVAVRTGRGDFLVGPDNGLLVPAAEALGGVAEARILDNPGLRLPALSSTFHGRDLFAPAAAHLANGVPLGEFGPELRPSPLEIPEPVPGEGELSVAVLYPDDFGSLILGAFPRDLAAVFGPLEYGTALDVAGTRVRWAETFGDVAEGEPLLFADSSGRLALGVNLGSAAARFGLSAGRTVTLRHAG